MKSRIPKCIKKYEKKYFGFTRIQLTFLIIGMAVGGIAISFTIKTIPFELSMLLGALVAVVFAACGFLNVSGLNAIQIVKLIISEVFFKSNYYPYVIGGFNHEKER